LIEDPNLKDYSCIIIDEAHERNLNTDILLGVIKKIIDKNKDLKVIITSATLNEQLFKDYFKCKSINVSGRLYPVKIKNVNIDTSDSLQEVISLFSRKVEKIRRGN
jgi:HrpA-like RNA helicase